MKKSLEQKPNGVKKKKNGKKKKNTVLDSNQQFICLTVIFRKHLSFRRKDSHVNTRIKVMLGNYQVVRRKSSYAYIGVKNEVEINR